MQIANCLRLHMAKPSAALAIRRTIPAVVSILAITRSGAQIQTPVLILARPVVAATVRTPAQAIIPIGAGLGIHGSVTILPESIPVLAAYVRGSRCVVIIVMSVLRYQKRPDIVSVEFLRVIEKQLIPMEILVIVGIVVMAAVIVCLVTQVPQGVPVFVVTPPVVALVRGLVTLHTQALVLPVSATHGPVQEAV